MFGLVRMNTKLVNWNKESLLSPALLVVLAEKDLEIIPIMHHNKKQSLVCLEFFSSF